MAPSCTWFVTNADEVVKIAAEGVDVVREMVVVEAQPNVPTS